MYYARVQKQLLRFPTDVVCSVKFAIDVLSLEKSKVMLLKCCLILGFSWAFQETYGRIITRRSFSDESVHDYLTERTCWWNEVCKEEFQSHFRCRCPIWSFCRAPGRYYNAYCSMTATGYIWTQPGWGQTS